MQNNVMLKQALLLMSHFFMHKVEHKSHTLCYCISVLYIMLSLTARKFTLGPCTF